MNERPIARVLVRRPDAGVEHHRLEQLPLRIGRGQACDVVIEATNVSKFHAEIDWDGVAYVVRDLDSANGTFLDGVSVMETPLRNGAAVKVGPVLLEVQIEDEASQTTPEPPEILVSTTFEAQREAQDVEREMDLRMAYDRLRTAFYSVHRLLESRGIDELCERIIDAAFDLLDVESAVVMLRQRAGLIEITHRGEPVRVSQTVLEHVVESRNAVLCADAQGDKRFSASDSVIAAGARSLMCVPLVSGERVHGVLYTVNTRLEQAFRPRDLELLQGIGAGAGVALAKAALGAHLNNERATRERLGRYLSDVVVEQVVRGDLDDELGGEERDVTVLFCDIRGFTALTEQRPAAEVVDLLNALFEEVVEQVFEHRGMLDKFIGDAVMAVWGVPRQTPDRDARAALDAARDILAAVAALNERRARRGEVELQVGIGLASGRCVAGNVGSTKRLEYTVIGRAVNLAARLCDRAEAQQVIIDEETWSRAGKPVGWAMLPPSRVPGRQGAVDLYALSAEP